MTVLAAEVGARADRRTPTAPRQSVLMVDFAAPDGRTWWALGVGHTFAEALAFARDSCPTDTTWQPTSWSDVYGD